MIIELFLHQLTALMRTAIIRCHPERSDGFTKRYQIHKLVYFERYEDARATFERGKQLKNWSREKKNRLVETVNPEWKEIPLSDV